MKKIKGFLALFLALAMACSSLTVFAEEAQGEEPAEETPGAAAPAEEEPAKEPAAPAEGGDKPQAAPAGEAAKAEPEPVKEQRTAPAEGGAPEPNGVKGGEGTQGSDDLNTNASPITVFLGDNTIESFSYYPYLNINLTPDPGEYEINDVLFTYTSADTANQTPATLAINGNFEVKDEDYALHIHNNAGTDTVTVAGNVVSQGNTDGAVKVESNSGSGTATVIVDGKVETKEGGYDNAAVSVVNNNSTGNSTNIVEVGDCIADGIRSKGVSIQGYGDCTVIVDQNITAAGESSAGARINNESLDKNTLIVGAGEKNGNITGEKTGVILNGMGEKEIVATGTISGGEVSIQTRNVVEIANTQITAWSIKANDGKISDSKDTDDALQTHINYILRADTILDGIVTSVAGLVDFFNYGEKIAKKTWALNGDQSLELYTARAGDEPRMQVADTITINEKKYSVDYVLKVGADGAAIDGADEDNEGYYWSHVMEKTGGWWLRLVLRDYIDPDPHPQPKPQPEPGPVSVQAPALKTASGLGTPAAVRSAVKLVEVQDAENKVILFFLSDGTFRVRLEDRSTEKGTYRNENGRLVLAWGSSAVTVGEDGAFTYTSQKNAGLTYRFTLSPEDMQTLLKAAR